MRALALALPLFALTACKGGDDSAEPLATEVPSDMVGQASGGPAVESEYGTPVKDRVATIGLLNKRNNLQQDLTLKPGEARRVGNVVVKLLSCERTLPWESPEETGAFVQVFVEERLTADQPLKWRTVFSGWLFKNSPSLNVVEHPVYDVWVKACAMKFPGEEDSPSAAASSAAKPSGRASPKPSTSPSPTPSAAPSASPTPTASPAAAEA
ncbi:hypothetical protein B0I00_1642 [Novosphingobium kunmingense]|uniref:DUF2155 domain-containing protein n=1 Tax=Novosphingobium kunmingense TaxID=1211806 RepID=A0A2N0HKD1_9SPHN|nr:hypothetical protein B0I00_1642 [Novosphingobium kunmingense]